MLAVRLPDAIEQRLAVLASETGRTKTALVREAILEYIDELEDDHLAEARARRNRKTIALEDVERELGISGRVRSRRAKGSREARPRGAAAAHGLPQDKGRSA